MSIVSVALAVRLTTNGRINLAVRSKTLKSIKMNENATLVGDLRDGGTEISGYL